MHTDYLVLVTAVVSVGKINDCDIYRVNGVQFVPMWRPMPEGVTDPGDDRITEVCLSVLGLSDLLLAVEYSYF